ncbi:hypothetical protein EJ06DRAFT_530290 [Trichodelitschia bisporula]|uniref:Tim44-like domain-containing protein n=1 Tax=Trichodelitschia bisporula TaxID=703511 RepID=A0A6G1HWR3_9PEZI|nr:hypothetical protein EJ06DRAFT_530290 [Trichodelitschia bisporula]
MSLSHLRRPAVALLRQPPQWRPSLTHTRALTLTRTLQARSGARGDPMEYMRRGGESQPAPRAQARERDESSLPKDVGLFPDTLVMPTGRALPSLISNPRDRLFLEYQRLVQRLKDVGSQVHTRFVAFRDQKQAPKLGRKTIVPAAKSLHVQLYDSLAAGDVDALRSICGENLFTQYAARIGRRGQHDRYEWTLLSHSNRPRIVSNKITTLPLQIGNKPVAYQQAVVLIRSRQRLRKGRYDPLEKEVKWKSPSTEKEKTIPEYMVVQRRFIRDQWEPWIVWGFITPTSVKGLRESLSQVNLEE